MTVMWRELREPLRPHNYTRAASTRFHAIKIHRLRITDYMRVHGPFEPQRLPMEDMEYTTLPHVMKTLGDRFVKAD